MPNQTVEYLVALIVIILLGGCIGGWIVAGMQLAAGKSLVEYEPRRPVPWDGPTTLLLTTLYLGEHLLVSYVARAWYESFAPERFDPEAARTDPRFLVCVFASHVLLSVLMFVIGLAVLKTRSQATSDDVGFPGRTLLGDVRLGVRAFVLFVPPILAIQAVLTQFFKSEHPLMEGLKRDRSPELVGWSIAAAVVTAPLVEEFFFRGVLQGWFERLIVVGRRSQVAAASATPENASSAAILVSTSPSVETGEVSPQPPSWAPIVASSAIFTLPHSGYGPDPIPIFLLALALGYLYRQTHRLWPGIVVHFLLNLFSTTIVLLGIEPAKPM